MSGKILARTMLEQLKARLEMTIAYSTSCYRPEIFGHWRCSQNSMSDWRDGYAVFAEPVRWGRDILREDVRRGARCASLSGTPAGFSG
jgi:hypothetical protein